MGKMSLTSCRALSTPGKFSNVDRYECVFDKCLRAGFHQAFASALASALASAFHFAFECFHRDYAFAFLSLNSWAHHGWQT